MEKIQSENEEIAYRQQVVNEYRADVEKLARYLPWFESKKGFSVQQSYSGSGVEKNSISFPVYDSTLLAFVKEAQRTKLMDRNYRYVYSRCRIRILEDELLAVKRSTIKEWSEAVEKGVFLAVIAKMKENLDFWDHPVQTRVVNVSEEKTEKKDAGGTAQKDTFF